MKNPANAKNHKVGYCGLYDSLCMRRVVVQMIVTDVKLRACPIRRNSRYRFEDGLRAETGEYTWCMSIFSTTQVKNSLKEYILSTIIGGENAQC